MRRHRPANEKDYRRPRLSELVARAAAGFPLFDELTPEQMASLSFEWGDEVLADMHAENMSKKTRRKAEVHFSSRCGHCGRPMTGRVSKTYCGAVCRTGASRHRKSGRRLEREWASFTVPCGTFARGDGDGRNFADPRTSLCSSEFLEPSLI